MYSASFHGVKWSGRGSDRQSPSSAELANGLDIYLRLPSVPALAFNGVTFTFTERVYLM
jgi:hypothetical protein